MVLKRKLNCGSNGFDFSVIPKAPRSSRRKVSCKRSDDVDGSQICGIDLLASLVEKLLEETESSSSYYAFEGDNHDHLGVEIKQEHQDQGNPAPKATSENTSENSSLENDCILKQTPCKRAYDSDPLVVGCENKKVYSDFLVESGSITEETGLVTADTGFEEGEARDGLIVETFDDLKLPPGMDDVPNGSFEEYRNHSKLVFKDDDEKYCRYYKLSEKCKSYRPLTRVTNRRIKYGRAFAGSKCFEDNTRTDACLKALYRKRKLCHGYNPWKNEAIHRKRRLSEKGLVVNSDEGLSSGSVTNSPQKGDKVKFSIKSLKIPELFIEVPKTATVGSLKRTVREAVTALLGGGICIGVLLQGKKVRDDNNNLSQTGLSCIENLDKLGFTLEPRPQKLSVPLCSQNPVVSTPTYSTERSEVSPALDSRTPLPLQDADHMTYSRNIAEKNLELVPCHSDILADEQPSSDSRALVPVSALDFDELAIVPFKEKPKRKELSQRRTRRPFSVTEVEALVQAVEEIGTGRWRDVKLRSFENASHRTYVDLKDKWKTLVHTANISPQQRRGEPVPQVLLDRVLAAHRCWSQHQMKQNGKHQVAATMVVQAGSSM